MSVSRIPTPDFSGKTLREVDESNAAAANGKSLFTRVVPAGKQGGVVASQSPVAGTLVYPGEQRLVITLKTADSSEGSFLTTLLQNLAASASRTTKVPEMTGDNENEARAELTGAKLTGRFVGDSGGVVSRVDPPVGREVRIDSVVTVTLQIPRVEVPPLRGMNRDAAAGALAEHSLQLGKVLGDDSDASTVAEQSVTPGTEVPRYSPVDVTMQAPNQAPGEQGPGAGQPPSPDQTQPASKKPAGKGKPTVVPPLQGMDLGRAQLQLQKAGLQVGDTSGDVARGVVQIQSPPARARVARGTEVALKFMVAVPPRGNPRWAAVIVLLGMAGVGLLGVAGAWQVAQAKQARRLIRGLGGVPTFRVGSKRSDAKVVEGKTVMRMTVRLRTKDVTSRVEAAKEPTLLRGRVTHGD
jgi:beta-lactam-binding protein with PASTA domain